MGTFPPIISYDRLHHAYASRRGRVDALSDFSLDIPEGQFVAIVGPSGCGKSTLLNLTVGLTKPTAGSIRYRDAYVEDVNPAIGYITQQDNLFPWRTIQKNVEFGLEVRGVGRQRRQALARDLLERVGLGGFERQYVHELSGGMRQRAHIVRTLAYDPDVILMDEPFGSLDVQTRLQNQQLLLDLWQARRKTIIFITHDLVEAIALADRVIVMTRRPGTIKAVVDVPLPRPRDMYHVHTTGTFREIYDPVWTLLQEEMVAERNGHMSVREEA